MAPDQSYQPKVYRDNGGDREVTADGGRHRFEDDADLSWGDADDINTTFDGTNLIWTGVPTSDPLSVGALWSNSGVLTLSAGPPSGP